MLHNNYSYMKVDQCWLFISALVSGDKPNKKKSFFFLLLRHHVTNYTPLPVDFNNVGNSTVIRYSPRGKITNSLTRDICLVNVAKQRHLVNAGENCWMPGKTRKQVPRTARDSRRKPWKRELFSRAWQLDKSAFLSFFLLILEAWLLVDGVFLTLAQLQTAVLECTVSGANICRRKRDEVLLSVRAGEGNIWGKWWRKWRAEDLSSLHTRCIDWKQTVSSGSMWVHSVVSFSNVLLGFCKMPWLFCPFIYTLQ